MKMLQELIKARDVEGIKAFMAEHRLKVEGGKIVPIDSASSKKIKDLEGFWNQRQQARKILLNSLYGALLNEGLRFYDERLGQSVTLTGRSIVQHMNAKANEAVLGEYNYTGEAIVYADTDSCYFTALPLKEVPEWQKVLFEAFHEMEKVTYADEPDKWVYQAFDFDNRAHMIRLYDDISDTIINESFPEFMARSFNTSLERGAIIKAGRELVASAGLFIKKKKYAVLMYDKEGDRLDGIKPGENEPSPGKLKAMGLDLKRSDTPKVMQNFLNQTLLKLLTNETKIVIFDDITEFREEFKTSESWEKGSPKAVKGLSKYRDKLDEANAIGIMSTASRKKGIVQMPGHVRASLNWNKLCEINRDRYAMRITDGTRIVVCKLRPNVLKMDSIAFPVDEPHLPEWFKELPFDDVAMEETIIDKKLDNLLGVLEWDLESTKAHPRDDFIVFK